MKYIAVRIVTMLCALLTFTFAESKTIEAGLGISFQSTHTLPVEYRDHAKRMVVEHVWSTIAFVESGSVIRISNFPISLNETGNIELHLVPSTVDGSTQLFIGNERFPIPQVRTFTGHIVDDPGSTILLTHAHGELSGWIEQSNGSRIHIAPMEEIDNSSHHMIYDEQIQSELRKSGGSCMTDESSITIPTPDDLNAYIPKSDRTFGNNLLELQVIVEGTTSFFNGPGRKDSIRTAEFMIGLMNGVNSLYRKELNIAIVIPRLQIWTTATPDPYASDGNAPALLDEVESRWSKLTTIKRDIVHCLDAVPATNGLFVLGIANGIGNVCSGTVSNAYSVSGIFKNGLAKINDYVGDIVTIAHELGHNIGSYHTHNCTFWPPRGLDSCMTSGTAFRGRGNYSVEACYKNSPQPNPGSIMSYCHLTNPSRSVAFTFLPRVSTYLRNYLETRPCIEAATQPTIRMIFPWGQQSFIVGDQTNIEWTSHRVNNVNIEFSSDGGISWRELFVSRPAVTEANGTGIFKWTIPDNPTTKGRIRVVDANNGQIRDTSWADFTIAKASLTLNTDLRSKRFGQKERVNLSWTKEFIERVDIEFSSNNGSTWTLITDSTSSSSMTVDIPDVESKNCFFRALDISRKLISQTGPFEIGKETIALTNPVNDDTLCIGQADTVRWTSQFMDNSKVFLEYRALGQTTWRRISSLGHDAAPGNFVWNVPTLTDGQYQFRSSYRLDTSIASSPVTIIITSQGSCAKVSGIKEESTIAVFPNPAKEIINIQHIPMNCETPSIKITDAKGRAVLDIFMPTKTAQHSLELSVRSLANGQYFMYLQCGTSSFSTPFTINR